MGPFHIPWSSFASILLLLLAFVLALGWALWDKRRGDS